MSDRAISVLLCGAGSRGSSVFCPFIKDNPELAKLVAVAEPQAERRQKVAEMFGLGPDQVFENWQEAVAKGVHAQAVIVATDDFDHLEPSIAFLKQGYHLLLEKPMAPSLAECREIVEAAQFAEGMSAVCHVLRYTPYFRLLRELIEQDAVGQIHHIRHLEPVNYWHFAHSFVRGNWRNTKISNPFILAKCCHDMDILAFLMDERPTQLQSFGTLSHFKAECAPNGATPRCVDCPLKTECAYSATKFYGLMLEKGLHCWPLDVVTSEFEQEALQKALETGPYGRCVYHCDNDVCDHQVVNFQFGSGATASMVATAFTEIEARETDIFGSKGMLRGNGKTIQHHNFRDRSSKEYEVEFSGHHLGGDEAMLRDFFQAIQSDDPTIIKTSPGVSLLSHEMAFLAEVSRKDQTVVKI